jgi:hypothetical protein
VLLTLVLTISFICALDMCFAGRMTSAYVSHLDSYQKLALGTDTGIWVTVINSEIESGPRKAIEIEKVSQIEMLGDYGFAVILAGKFGVTFSCVI